MSEQEALARLRDEIAEVDRRLLDLLRQRMQLAAEVGHAKAALSAPIVVRDVEDIVYSRAREHAEACGVSAEVMEAIFAAIVRGSVERQHRVGVTLRSRRGGRILIVGGAGGMGRWFADFLSLVGHAVETVDPAWAERGLEAGRYAGLAEVPDLDRFDAILVAVPLGATPTVLDEVTARTPRGIVVEIASIKDHLAPALARARAAGLTVACLHPMFGPSKSPYSPLTFVLACQQDEETERRRIVELLRHPYTNVVAIPFPHHDRLMGWLLGLAHLTGMLFGTALARSGLDPDQLLECASTTFARQAATALSVLSEDPDLYLDIQRLNPHREEVYAAARAALERLVRLVGDGDRGSFRAELATARQVLTATEDGSS